MDLYELEITRSSIIEIYTSNENKKLFIHFSAVIISYGPVQGKRQPLFCFLLLEQE